MKKYLALASLAVTAVAPAALPAAAHADQTVTALGNAQIPVKPSNRHKNAAIKRAVDKAYAKAVPAAIADAREDAERIAAASGLKLGAIQSVDENVAQVGYFYGPPSFGRFGPDQYCGTITRVHHVRDRRGVLHRVSRREHQCFVPETAAASLAVTFAASSSG
jgi:hypothetical protein